MFIGQEKQHPGYFSFHRCAQDGCRRNGPVVFTSDVSPLRADHDFHFKGQQEHHCVLLPFERLPVDMVETFPTERMHTVCFGVRKCMIGLWRNLIEERSLSMSLTEVREANDGSMMSCRCLTCEFRRFYESMIDIEY